MALKIRLRRMGRKKSPHYRIVVAESSMPRDGRFVAKLGHYNPTTQPTTLQVNVERSREWLARGAVPTDTVASLLKTAGVYGGAAATESAVVDEVRSAAGKAASTVAAVAGAAAERVRDAAEGVVDLAKDAVEAVAERVSGEDTAAENDSAQA